METPSLRLEADSVADAALYQGFAGSSPEGASAQRLSAQGTSLTISASPACFWKTHVLTKIIPRERSVAPLYYNRLFLFTSLARLQETK